MHGDVATASRPLKDRNPSAAVPFAPQPLVPLLTIDAWSALTAFGDLASTWDSLLEGRCIDDHARVPYELRHGRAQALADAVASETTRAGCDSDAAVIVATSKGSVEDWLACNTSGGLRPEGLSDLATRLAVPLCGPRLTVSAACASGLHALVRGAMMIRSRQVRQVLVVAVEASLHPLFLGSFQRLGVLAPPGHGCRPFDESRRGFLMSEAAAAVLLRAGDCRTSDVEAPRGVASGDNETVIQLEHFALAGDGTHLTGGDPDGTVLRRMLSRVMDGRPVDLVHAHGTGTVAHDPVELAAIEATVPAGNDLPSLYSHKGALGHSLGASGLVSVVLNCEAHRRGVVPPNAQTRAPLAAGRVSIDLHAVRRPVRRSVAVAAGFGGAMAAVSLVGGGLRHPAGGGARPAAF
jgi:3-oxoacyl-[acyl-carrier-protein] synthase II